MDRVVVVGSPGAGKSTLARTLSKLLDADHVDLDGLWWTKGWVPVAPGELARRVALRLAASERWVVDGCYLDQVGVQVWSAADTLVWLNLPRTLTFRRVVRRSIGRLVRKEIIHNGNREQWRVLGQRSLMTLWRRIPNYHAGIAALLEDPIAAHLDVFRLRTPDDVTAWVQTSARRAGTNSSG